MSSFMVSNKTLNILANYIYQEQPKETGYSLYYDRDDPKKIFERLCDLNYHAMCEHFNEEQAKALLNTEEYRYEEIPDISEHISREEIICRLECVLFKCNEGMVPYRDDAYIGLKLLSSSLARDEVLAIYEREMRANGWWD